MSFFAVLFFSSSILISIYFISSFSHIHAAVFDVQNNCTYTVWAAAVPGGGRELQQGQSWVFNTDPNFRERGRIWGRTNCNLDENGIGKCESGDCNGALLCVSYGNTPSTIAEYQFKSINDLDFFDISLVDGFNFPMEFSSTSSGCDKSIKCAADINRVCPTELRDPGGCNNPCSVFDNDQFCCYGATNCGPTVYSKFFKDLCPSVYTYPLDDKTSMFTCPNITAYKVVFCP